MKGLLIFWTTKKQCRGDSDSQECWLAQKQKPLMTRERTKGENKTLKLKVPGENV